MGTYDVCKGGPGELSGVVLCLDELSKNGRGDLRLLTDERKECRTLDCVSLTTEHLLLLELTSHTCDSPPAARLDGRFVVRDLTTVFAGGTGERRGMHTGQFDWKVPSGVLRGALSGMTNVGTHRDPVFGPAQQCDERGVLEGRLCGRVLRTSDPELAGARVFGVYRIRFDAGSGGGQGAVSGTVEGVVVRECPPVPDCVGFTVAGSGANPRVEGAATIEISDVNGPVPTSWIRTWGGHTGLHLVRSATVTFAAPVSQVEVTLVHFKTPATATAFDTAGAQLAAVTMAVPQQMPETLVLTAPGLALVVIDSPQDEVLMSRLCVRAG
ncbi:hypothetical protein [Streptomyces sp. NPDC005374]|uniref:hypothetical protein n=1 Tax=Streptomyces sp. NPDC005374 TaxID=3364713 RepID=UPI0036C439E0